MQGYNAQKASFSRTIHVRQIGHALYHLDTFNEDYLITLPPIYIDNLIYGSPFVELHKSTTITSSSGFVAKIDYSGKGWVSGKKNTFTATLFKEGKEKDVLYSIDGHWNESFTVKEGSAKHGKVLEVYDSNKHPTTKLKLPPLEEQSPRESKKAWNKVANAIMKGDMDTTGHEKSKIEVQQREMRKKEQTEGKEWQRTFFSRAKEDPIFDKLAKPTGEKIEADKTNGIWRFDQEKAKNAKRPFDFSQ